MKCYRIKHIPTGFYFCPSRKIKTVHKNGNGQTEYVKSNLSKKGKIYHSEPSLGWIKDGYSSHLMNFSIGLDGRFRVCATRQRVLPFVENEWEIEEI